MMKRNFNPRSPWGERLAGRENPTKRDVISIHAPRGGSDNFVDFDVGGHVAFQSTLPVGGATICCCCCVVFATDFNPRSPWGERPSSHYHVRNAVIFQSTLPVGGATNSRPQHCAKDVFQSTLPVGGATRPDDDIPVLEDISIHAPRGGSDASYPCRRLTAPYFNPRSPWGERPSEGT